MGFEIIMIVGDDDIVFSINIQSNDYFFYVDRFRASNLGFHTPLWKMNDDMLRYVAVIHLQSGIFDLSQRRFR